MLPKGAPEREEPWAVFLPGVARRAKWGRLIGPWTLDLIPRDFPSAKALPIAAAAFASARMAGILVFYPSHRRDAGATTLPSGLYRAVKFILVFSVHRTSIPEIEALTPTLSRREREFLAAETLV